MISNNELLEIKGGAAKYFYGIGIGAVISFIVGLVICFVISYDVLSNGYVKTDLESMGIFMLCVGGYMAGSGIPKIFGERAYAKFKGEEKESEHEDDEFSDRHKRRKQNNNYDKELLDDA